MIYPAKQLSIQSIKLETLVYTPGKLGLPQPIPKEVTPIIQCMEPSTVKGSGIFTWRGPPESPCNLKNKDFVKLKIV